MEARIDSSTEPVFPRKDGGRYAEGSRKRRLRLWPMVQFGFVVPVFPWRFWYGFLKPRGHCFYWFLASVFEPRKVVFETRHHGGSCLIDHFVVFMLSCNPLRKRASEVFPMHHGACCFWFVFLCFLWFYEVFFVFMCFSLFSFAFLCFFFGFLCFSLFFSAGLCFFLWFLCVFCCSFSVFVS